MDTKRNRILIALDGSEQSLEAARYLIRDIPLSRAEFVLFHVLSTLPESYWDLGDNPQLHSRLLALKTGEIKHEAEIREFMKKTAALLVEAGASEDAVKIAVQPRKAGVARDIVIESAKGYDAVVTGRTGKGKLAELLIGSVANKLIEKLSHVSVGIIGGYPPSGKILIGLDGSDGAMRAVEFAGRMFGGPDCEALLLNVLRRMDIMTVFDQPVHLAEIDEYTMEYAKDQMKTVFEKAKDTLVNAGFEAEKIETKMITDVGSRAGTIVETAVEGGYGSIIVGRRGLSNVQEFFMGRVSNKIIQLAKGSAIWVVS